VTDRYAVIGHPVSHSKSPLIHGGFARQLRQDMVYGIVEAPLDGFVAAVDAFRASGGSGMNVTAPFKLQAFEIATEASERARLAGASNALKFERDRVLAENFDGVGLVNDIQRNLAYPIRGHRVLLLGAGGAARGVLLPLLAENPRLLAVANRTPSHAEELRRHFADVGDFAVGGLADFAPTAFDIVINATSASLHAETPAVPGSCFGRGSLAYEMVYGKGLTPFLALAHASGAARLADGVGMLVEQAAEGFAWWRGVRPDTRGTIDRLTVPLVERM
jgi:shikimate dehydrogenase